MNILVMKEEYKAKGKPWTEALEKRWLAALLQEKRDLFDDMEIPFPKSIETKFYEAVAKGNRNAEICLDQMCHKYIEYALDNYAEVLYGKLITEYDGDTIYEKELKKLVGKYGITELTKAGLIKLQGCFRGQKLYAI